MINDLMPVVAANLRRLRGEQGRSLSELARASGIAKATLSALEAGKGNPTIETLSALATALGVPFGDLLAGGAPEPVHVVHAARGHERRRHRQHLRLIVRLPGVAADRALRGALPAALQARRRRHGPGTREHVLVTQGALRTGPADRTVDLRAGDYAGFAGDEMHLYEAGPRGARALLIMQWASQP